MIGISVLTLVPGVFGGSSTYARALVRALARVGELDYRVLAPSLVPDAGEQLPTTVVSGYRASPTVPGRVAAMALATAAPGRVRRELAGDRLAAVHYALTVPLPRLELPSAVTVHDVLHLVRPDAFTRVERAYRRIVYRSVVRADLLISPSGHGRDVLVERTGVDAGRIRVIHHGVDHQRFRPGDEERRRPVILYPADGYPHKNHGRLLEGFALVRRERPELELMLVGRMLERLPATPGVVVRARVGEDELTQLYRSAAALVFPSLHEIFGMPPLEAMASGCPVAAARAGALPEVCGDAARFFDPGSAESIAQALLDVLADPEPWSRRGLARAAAFSWEECARRHDDVYRELADSVRV